MPTPREASSQASNRVNAFVNDDVVAADDDSGGLLLLDPSPFSRAEIDSRTDVNRTFSFLGLSAEALILIATDSCSKIADCGGHSNHEVVYYQEERWPPEMKCELQAFLPAIK